MKYLTQVIQKLLTGKVQLPTGKFHRPTGRWNIDYCNVKMNQKIDLSNEDHCGPCGQYALTKIETKNKNEIHLEKPTK